MKTPLKRLAAVLTIVLALALAAPAAASAAAETGQFFVTGYVVTTASGAPARLIQKGDTVNVKINIKNPGIKTQQLTDISKVDITRMLDSFTGGNAAAEITSSADSPLELSVSVNGAAYTGSGRSIKLALNLADIYTAPEIIEVPINEVMEYETPKPADPPSNVPEAAPSPIVLISRSDIKKPIGPNQEFSVTLYFKNLGPALVKTPVVTLSPSDSMMLTGGTSTFVLPDIKGGMTESLTVTLKTGSTISSANQPLNVDLKFNYYSNQSLAQGSSSEKVSIPAAVKEQVSAPPVIITRKSMDKPISAGDTFEMSLTFKNAGETALLNPVAYFSVSDSLLLLNDTSTVVLDEIAPGKSKTVTLRLKAAKTISSTTQSVSADLKFNYDSGSAIVQGTASERITLSSNVTSATQPMDAAIPNVIISEFGFGEDSVAAGKDFTFKFGFTNTSAKTKIENIVATVDGGENFTMNNSTNTFHYKALDSGDTQYQEVPMQVISTAKTGAHTIDISFRYEYVDNGKRSSASTTVKVSIPVYQTDRFQLNAPTLPGESIVGEETSITMAYVNKGKGEISNVEASIVGDVDSVAAIQYLGNFESGKSGNIGFAVTPRESGEISLVIKISYEDANAKVVTREFPVTLNVQEPAPVDMGMGFEEPEEKSPAGWILYVGIAAGAIAILVAIRAIVKKKKAKKSNDNTTWNGWDEPSEAPASSKEEHLQC